MILILAKIRFDDVNFIAHNTQHATYTTQFTAGIERYQ